MSFKMEDYQQLALRTEAPIEDMTKKRLVRCYEQVKDALEESVGNGEMLDRLKKFVFYLREDEEMVDSLLPSYPTGPRRERIEQLAPVLHALIGLMTEIGELNEIILAYIEHDEKIDAEHVKEEGSDIAWYLNLLLWYFNSSIPKVAEANIAKLKARYPDKFTTANALSRDTAKEMEEFTKVS